MVRKFAAALVVLAITVGAVFAEEVRGTFVKFTDDTLTIKVDDKEKEYKIPSDLTIKRKIKGEEKEVPASRALSKAKEGSRIILTVDGGKVTEVKMGGRGKKQ